LAFFCLSIQHLARAYPLRWCGVTGSDVFFSQVFVPPHPLIKHWVSVLRNEQTPCAIFSACFWTA
jgi:hypothetical protein